MICKKCGYKTENDISICPFCGYDESKDNIFYFSGENEKTNNENIKKVVIKEYDGPTYDDYEKEDNEKMTGIRTELGYLNIKTQAWHHLLYACVSYIFLYFFGGIFGSLLVAFYEIKGYDFDCIRNNTPCSIEVSNMYDFINNLASVIGELLVVVITAFIFFKFLRNFFQEFKNKKTWYWYGIGFALMYGLLMVYSLIITALNLKTDDSANQQAVISMVSNTPLLGFLFTVVVAPLFEELVFRFGLFRTFTHHNKKIEIIGLVITTITFAMIHMLATFQEVFADPSAPNYELLKTDLLSLPSYLIGAFCLTFVYYKSKNLLPSMLLHITWNTMSFITILGEISEQTPQVISLITQFITRLF